jgi:predicted regulator of Ras-like GTPase activity (Roadblock/LC7/MglB family)
MFRALKKLFGRSVDEEVESRLEVSNDFPSRPRGSTPRAQPLQTSSTGAELALPLNAVLTLLPPDFQARVNQSYASEVDIVVSMGKVLPQLAHGSVKISFGELRQASPRGTFSDEDDLDQIMVELPLPEILSRMNPALLKRRPSQKKAEVPEEVTGPFATNGQGFIVAAPPPKPFTAPAMAPARPRPVLAPAAETVGAAAAIPFPDALRHLATTPAAALRSTATPVVVPAAPRESECLIVVLGELSNAWPEAVRQEIAQLNFPGATLALPMEVLENELKHGKVAFTWKLLRSMIQSAPATAAVSVHDGVVLELPLNIIAPLFLARKCASHQQAKITLSEDIPDLFSSSARQPPAAAPVASEFLPTATPTPRREEETNYYIWKDGADTPDATATVPAPRPAAASTPPGTSFTKRFPTPNEIVRKASSLEGVVGSLIALADGLLVAKELPPDMNGETLAAFFPQIFGRVSQSARELRMGELSNLSFTVGNVPWKIFRVGGMFFAAYGCPGEPLPSAQLVAIVAELDQRTK